MTREQFDEDWRDPDIAENPAHRCGRSVSLEALLRHELHDRNHGRTRISAAVGVYLFHYWAWKPIKKVLADFSVTVLHPDVQALLVLFPICFIMMKFVEKPANRLGRIVLTRLHRHGKKVDLDN